MTETACPPILYKYYAPALVQVLESAQVRFGQRSVLNDPFEMAPSLEEFRSAQIDAMHVAARRQRRGLLRRGDTPTIIRAVDAAVADYYQDLDDRFAVFCLSAPHDHLTMWAHYAEAHTGFVVGFDTRSDFFAPRFGRAQWGLLPVVYTDIRPHLPGDNETMSKTRWLEFLRQHFYTKSLHWAYEQEWRFIAQPSVADRTAFDDAHRRLYLFKFPRPAVREVILGCRMAQERVNAIAEVLSAGYPDAKLLRAELDKERFALRFEPTTM